VEQRPQQWQQPNAPHPNTQYPQAQQWNSLPNFSQPPQGQQPFAQSQYYSPPMAQPYNPNNQPQYAQNQQRPLPPQPPVKKANGLVQALSIISSLLFVVGGIFTLISFVNSQVNSNQVNSATIQTPTVQPTVQAAKVGEAITLSGISCTLVSVDYTFGPSILLIDIKIVNNSQSEYSSVVSDFQLESNSGNILGPNQVGMSTLAPGGQTDETLEFDYIDSSGVKLLLWQPQGYSQDLTHYWKLDSPKQSGSSNS